MKASRQKILSIGLSVLFIAFAALQYNDPDAFWWACGYLFVASISILILKYPQLQSVAFKTAFLFALGAGISIYKGIFNLQTPWWMTEEFNEAGGSLISALALFYLAKSTVKEENSRNEV